MCKTATMLQRLLVKGQSLPWKLVLKVIFKQNFTGLFSTQNYLYSHWKQRFFNTKQKCCVPCLIAHSLLCCIYSPNELHCKNTALTEQIPAEGRLQVITRELGWCKTCRHNGTHRSKKNESVPLYNSSSHTVNEPTARHLHKRTYSMAARKQSLTQARTYVEKSDKAKDDGDYDT